MTAPWMSTLEAQARIRVFLDRLAADPPRSLLLEGGTADQRRDCALFWAARLNCREEARPCGQCRTCVQIVTDVFRDLILVNGSEGAISIDTVREVRSVLGDPPAGQGPRVIVFAEAQALGVNAANALLKSLEEPRPGNVFVLLAPSRETLLPTLVSRSVVLTLSWPRSACEDAELADWTQALAGFVQAGQGAFLSWTGKKGAVDAPLASRVLRDVQRALVQAGYGEPQTDLARILTTRLDAVAARQAGVVVENALECLDAGANPTLTLEWAAVRLWGVLH